MPTLKLDPFIFASKFRSSIFAIELNTPIPTLKPCDARFEFHMPLVPFTQLDFFVVLWDWDSGKIKVPASLNEIAEVTVFISLQLYRLICKDLQEQRPSGA